MFFHRLAIHLALAACLVEAALTGLSSTARADAAACKRAQDQFSAAVDEYKAWLKTTGPSAKQARAKAPPGTSDCELLLPFFREDLKRFSALRRRYDPVRSACTVATEEGAAEKQAALERKIQKCEAEVARPNTPSRSVPAVVQPAQQHGGQQQSANCSDITGTGVGSGTSNCAPSSGAPGNIQQQIPTVRQAPPSLPRVVVLSPPQCSMCDVLKTVGEVLPDFAEKLNDINFEKINDVEPPLFGGGPNTLHPYLPRRPLVPVTEPQDPLDAINDIKDIGNDAKELSHLGERTKEAEDYAQKCEDGFLDAAWKAFTGREGSYVQKAKAAKDSVKKCIKATLKYIKDTIANGGVDPDASSEVN